MVRIFGRYCFPRQFHFCPPYFSKGVQATDTGPARHYFPASSCPYIAYSLVYMRYCLYHYTSHVEIISEDIWTVLEGCYQVNFFYTISVPNLMLTSNNAKI